MYKISIIVPVFFFSCVNIYSMKPIKIVQLEPQISTKRCIDTKIWPRSKDGTYYTSSFCNDVHAEYRYDQESEALYYNNSLIRVTVNKLGDTCTVKTFDKKGRLFLRAGKTAEGYFYYDLFKLNGVHTERIQSGESESIYSPMGCAFSPDSRYFAIKNMRNIVQVFNVSRAKK